jgi:hypothetical protein
MDVGLDATILQTIFCSIRLVDGLFFARASMFLLAGENNRATVRYRNERQHARNNNRHDVFCCSDYRTCNAGLRVEEQR